MNRAELSSKLQAIGKVISAKNITAILDDFLFEVSNNKMNITASNMETTITTSILVSTEEDELYVNFTVDAQIMIGIIKALNCENVSIEINDVSKIIVVNYEIGKYEIPMQSAGTYPKPNQMVTDIIKFAVDPSIIRNGISRTVFATCSNVNRPALMGVNITIKDELLSFGATDRYKVASIDNQIPSTSVYGSFIIKASAALIIKDILSKAKGFVDITFDNSAVIFETKEFTIYTRTITAKFPNYKGVINRDNGTSLIVDRLALTSAVEHTSLCVSKASYLIRIEVSNNTMHVSAQDDDFKRSAKEKLQCSYDGGDMVIGLLLGSLLEILKNIHSDEIEFKIKSPSLGCIILPSCDYDNETLVMMTMPLALNN